MNAPTPAPSEVEPWLVEAVRHRVTLFTDQLRGLADTAVKVPNLDWTVADLGQHVACLPSYWRGFENAGAGFVPPDDFAAFSDAARAHITEADPIQLAALIDSEFGAYLLHLAEADPTIWVYGVETGPRTLYGFCLNELIMHGQDLAGVTGADAPSYDQREANVGVDAMMVTVPCFIDPTKAAAQPDGVYRVSFKGGNDYTWTKQGRELRIEPGRPDRADAHMKADPAMFLLSSLGRVSQIRAALSGKMITYGKRPWRFLGLGTMAVEGV